VDDALGAAAVELRRRLCQFDRGSVGQKALHQAVDRERRTEYFCRSASESDRPETPTQCALGVAENRVYIASPEGCVTKE
jgi:hypothetical protein